MSLNITTPIFFCFFSNTPLFLFIQYYIYIRINLFIYIFYYYLFIYSFSYFYIYYSQFVSGMPRAIEYLYLSHNKIMSLPSDGSTDLHLPALKLLDVSGNLTINFKKC